MAQPARTVQMKVAVDMTELDEALRLARILERTVRDLKVQLARTKEQLIGLDGRLSEHGIGLILEDT